MSWHECVHKIDVYIVLITLQRLFIIIILRCNEKIMKKTRHITIRLLLLLLYFMNSFVILRQTYNMEVFNYVSILNKIIRDLLWWYATKMPTISVVKFLLVFCSINRSQHVVVDGCRNKLVNVVSGMTHNRVFGPSQLKIYVEIKAYLWIYIVMAS